MVQEKRKELTDMIHSNAKESTDWNLDQKIFKKSAHFGHICPSDSVTDLGGVTILLKLIHSECGLIHTTETAY